MGKRRVFAALLALAVTVGSLALPARAAFTDTTGHWAETAITKWSEEYSIINGYEDGTFRPDNSITRGAFAGILDRFLKFQSTSPAGTFSDLSGNYWEDAILKLHASGVYLGNNGQALAGDTITRQQAVTMIARAFNISGESATVYYLDADQVADYAKPYLAEMSALGYITDSSDGYFRPTDAITRAEIVTILDNMIEVLIQTSTTYAQDVEGTVMINAAEGAYLQGMTITGDLILAPGVTGTVTLENVTIQGTVRNFGSAVVTDLSQQPEEPEQPSAIQPSDVYTPSETTGEYLTYSNQQIPIYAGVERNRFSQGDFMWDPDRPDRLIYTGDDYRTRFGIDVSAYQNRASANNTIDWEAAKADGVEFAMVRIGLRGYGSGSIMEDAFYAQNIDGRATRSTAPWPTTGRCTTAPTGSTAPRRRWPPPALWHSASASKRPATTPWSTPGSTSATSNTTRAPWSRTSPGTPSTRARAPSSCTPPCTITWTTGSIPASALWPASAATWM